MTRFIDRMLKAEEAKEKDDDEAKAEAEANASTAALAALLVAAPKLHRLELGANGLGDSP